MLVISFLLITPAVLLQGREVRDPEPVEREWVVREVFPAIPADNNCVMAWELGRPMRDFNGDGAADYFATGNLLKYLGQNQLRSLSRLTWMISSESKPSLDLSIQGLKWNNAIMDSCMLNSPTGSIFVTKTNYSQQWSYHDGETGQFLGWIPFPPPPAVGLPQIFKFDILVRAGDLNGDGYEDAFFESETGDYLYCGLLDGATMTVAWQYWEPDRFHRTPAQNLEVGPWPDLDGDGVGDYLFTCRTFQGGQDGHTFAAVSGVDGSRIWRRTGVGGPTFPNGFVQDISGDGIADGIVVIDSNEILAIDGATGQTLWRVPPLSLLPHMHPDAFQYSFAGPKMVHGVPGSATDREVVLRTEMVIQFPLGHAVWEAMIHLDPADGSFLGLETPPFDLQPWFGDVLDPNTGNLAINGVGDVDRDGFKEFGLRVESPSRSTFAAAYHLAILGQKTLFLPEEADRGDTVAGRVTIPTAPGMRYRLLLSSSFTHRRGHVVDGWNTHFPENDPVLLASNAAPPAHGPFDADGVGRFEFRIPDRPQLAGKTLYARVIVRDPVRPDEVWTISSLGEMAVQ